MKDSTKKKIALNIALAILETAEEKKIPISTAEAAQRANEYTGYFIEQIDQLVIPETV